MFFPARVLKTEAVDFLPCFEVTWHAPTNINGLSLNQADSNFGQWSRQLEVNSDPRVSYRVIFLNRRQHGIVVHPTEHVDILVVKRNVCSEGSRLRHSANVDPSILNYAVSFTWGQRDWQSMRRVLMIKASNRVNEAI